MTDTELATWLRDRTPSDTIVDALLALLREAAPFVESSVSNGVTMFAARLRAVLGEGR